MQTFLPYPDYKRSAKTLDRQRLGKQRLEVMQLLRGILGEGKNGWKNHPAAKMWRDYPGQLLEYGLAICDEWRARGYKDSVRDTLLNEFAVRKLSMEKPPWLGDPAFHASHRSNLLRKNPDWYGQFGWTESPDLDYVWPV